MARREYTPAERQSNHTKIVLATFAALGVGALASILTESGLANFIGFALLVAVVAAAFWWLFASDSARPLQYDDDSFDHRESDVEIGKRIVKILKKRP